MKKYIILCISFLSISLSLFSQSMKQLQRLQEIGNEKQVSFVIKKQEAIERAKQLGIPVKQRFSNGAEMELMYFIGNQPMYYITNNLWAAATTSTDKIQTGGSSGYNLNGSTEELALWDAGRVRVTHQEFGGRATINDGAIDESNHATHVAGTMVAGGVRSYARGMAFQANILSYDWNNDEAEMAHEAAAGLFVSNHSYGYVRGWKWKDGSWVWYGNTSISNTEDYRFGFYDNAAREWDEIANNAPYYLICKSAGNDRGDGPGGSLHEIDGGADGFDCIAQNGVAKNILTIGAVYDVSDGYSSVSDVEMSGFSGWGPADDGRIKPDLVANGISLNSPIAILDNGVPSDSHYSSYSGTSMAAPNISGSVGLLLQHQRNNFGNVVFRSSTMKALLIHTADEAGPHPGPDYMFGWGLANFERAAELIEESANHCVTISEYNLTQGEVLNIPVVKQPGQQLRVTICWNDPAGTPPAASLNPSDRMLVNDIDLRVIGEFNVSYKPWVLDRNHPAYAASRGDNSVDNVEQVVVNSEYNGMYTIRISHKGMLQNNAQIVSVIISGTNVINTDVTISNRTYWADNSQWAHNNINVSNTRVRDGGDVTFLAGNVIRLENGFVTDNGAKFIARREESLDCSAGTFTPKSIDTIGISSPSRFIYERNIIEKPDRINTEPDMKPELWNSEISQNYTIYPNPSNGLVNVEFYGDIPSLIEIYNTSGNKLKSENTITNHFIQIDLSGFKKGVYMVKLLYNNQVITEMLVMK